MAKKRNRDLRPKYDLFKRKKPNNGTRWAEQLLQKLDTCVEPNTRER